jgi:hypothetical protein
LVKLKLNIKIMKKIKQILLVALCVSMYSYASAGTTLNFEFMNDPESIETHVHKVAVINILGKYRGYRTTSSGSLRIRCKGNTNTCYIITANNGQEELHFPNGTKLQTVSPGTSSVIQVGEIDPFDLSIIDVYDHFFAGGWNIWDTATDKWILVSEADYWAPWEQ